VEQQRERLRLYWIWDQMRRRCGDANNKAFLNYGGRGISVCDRWLSFAAFLADMGPRPAGGLLERKDNDGNYEPSNCTWATRKEQNSNRRNCIYVLDGEEVVTIKELCRRRGLSYRPIMKRIRDRGWPIDRAFQVPIGENRRPDL
jgi:hypothetical protein